NLKLRPRILNLAPGTRVVSNNFTMGAWSADQIVTAEDDCALYCVAYFWIVPAKVEGVWQLDGRELTLIQTFQMVSGTLKSGSNTMQVVEGRLEGNRITFTAGDNEYVGQVSGNTMAGVVSGGGNWKASRTNN
ncbi:MAG TPA: hypothetical protein VLX11_11270, partial [Candidatus Acidoferrales bacterium]|nr:hypothetical protein [Candidatus Acidoferrales bacterium]